MASKEKDQRLYHGGSGVLYGSQSILGFTAFSPYWNPHCDSLYKFSTIGTHIMSTYKYSLFT